MNSSYRMETRKKKHFIPPKEHTPNLTHKDQELNSEGAPFSLCHPSKRIKSMQHAALCTETQAAAAPNASPACPVTDLHCLVTSYEIKNKKDNLFSILPSSEQQHHQNRSPLGWKKSGTTTCKNRDQQAGLEIQPHRLTSPGTSALWAKLH